MARNISVVMFSRNWPSSGTDTPLAGSTIEANPRPICMEMICPVTMKIWKNS
ncbi:hypothetical protein D3C77_716250 [compost metagenome]